MVNALGGIGRDLIVTAVEIIDAEAYPVAGSSAFGVRRHRKGLSGGQANYLFCIRTRIIQMQGSGAATDIRAIGRDG